MKKLIAAICASSFFMVPLADAATAQGNVVVKAVVAGTCTVNPSAITFGLYDAATAKDATGTLTIHCTTTGLTGSVTLAGVAGGRQMNDGGSNFLNYEVYTDAAHGTVWAGTNTMALDPSGSDTSFTLYGEIPAGQTTVPQGNYQDTLIATVNY